MKKLMLYSCILLIAACGKKKGEPKNYISIVSLVKKQIASLDSNFSVMIKKIVITDTLGGDTTVISREQVKEAAKEFLDIPDLSDKKIAKKYKEETARYDDMLNRVVIEYNAIKPSEEYKNQQLLILPDQGEGDKVTNIIVTTEVTKDDMVIQKNLLWQMDKSFQVTTTTQKKGGPGQTIITKVIWNEDN